MDTGVIVDLETTGIDSEKDQIIEIGLLEFMLEDGQEPIITEMYGACEDPGFALSAEIIELTGLTDASLKGRQINWQHVQSMLGRASVIIAHNAAFDRGFLQKRKELQLSSAHWACSQRHIDWRGKKHRCRSLNHLAADYGFVNPFAHRALFDTATTFRIVKPFLTEMLHRSYEREILLEAVGAAFEVKDKLRERGYSWDAQMRVWAKQVFESELEQERSFLSDAIYHGHLRHKETFLS